MILENPPKVLIEARTSTKPKHNVTSKSKPNKCSCGRSFATQAAQSQHRADAPIHRPPPQRPDRKKEDLIAPEPHGVSERSIHQEDSFQESGDSGAEDMSPPERMINVHPATIEDLTGGVDDSYFASFERNPSQRPCLGSGGTSNISSTKTIMFVKAGEKAKKKKKPKKGGPGSKKSRTGSPAAWEDGDCGLSAALETALNWAICDKDCGWCGRCADEYGL